MNLRVIEGDLRSIGSLQLRKVRGDLLSIRLLLPIWTRICEEHASKSAFKLMDIVHLVGVIFDGPCCGYSEGLTTKDKLVREIEMNEIPGSAHCEEMCVLPGDNQREAYGRGIRVGVVSYLKRVGVTRRKKFGVGETTTSRFCSSFQSNQIYVM